MMPTLHTAYELLDTGFVLVLSFWLRNLCIPACPVDQTRPAQRLWLDRHVLVVSAGWSRSCTGCSASIGCVPAHGSCVAIWAIPGLPCASSWTMRLADHLMRIGDAVTQWPRIPANAIESLENGENAFPPMLEAIAGAERTVWLATYIFETDPVGQQFIRALARPPPARGVQVRVLVDGVGEWYSWPHVVPELHRAGVVARRFLPPRLLPPRLSLNMRNHRKLLLVDGHTGFLGGMNIGGREVGKSGTRRMADLHFKVRGPVLYQLGEAFGIDWLFAANETLAIPSHLPVAVTAPAASLPKVRTKTTTSWCR